MTVEHPWVLIIIPLLIWAFWKLHAKKQPVSIQFPNTGMLSKLENPRHRWLYYMPIGLRLLTCSLCILALSQPQLLETNRQSYSEGINIMVLLDLSKSMAETDLKPSRIDAAKKTIRQFIKQRRYDNIGLLVFGKEAFTSCPLTTDLSLLDTYVSRFNIGTVNPFGTAIGLAIATAIPRFKDTQKSNIIILLTDGVNNAGNIEPLTATKLAIQKGIKIYTIGVGGKKGYDKSILETIATQTQGKFYEAINEEELKNIYTDINKLETHQIAHKHLFETQELYPALLSLALLLLLLEIIINQLFIVKVP